MSDEWEKPPPQLVREKRKFPLRYLIFFIVGLYVGGVIVAWAVAGKQFPIYDFLEFWLFLVIILSIILVWTWWVTTSQRTRSVISAKDNTVVATVPVGIEPGVAAYDFGKGEIFVTTGSPGTILGSNRSR